ncbi:MAG: hypothetical protein JWL58_572 [Streptosporangiaceae bacterium]|nr:hypothetical protein [Streptosporangiaceae bacterium]
MRKIGSMLTVVVMGASALAVVPASSAEAASCKQRLSVSISPDPVTSNPYAGSSQATGTVRLRCRLGAHGARAQITTWWGGFTAPPSLWVARYSSTAHFPLNVFSNDRTQTHVVGVQLGALRATTPVTVLPDPVLSGFTISSPTLVGSQSVTGTVRLSEPAPPGGLGISLQVSPTSASPPQYLDVPLSADVPGGKTTASFKITADPAFRHMNFSGGILAYMQFGQYNIPYKVYVPLNYITTTPGVAALSTDSGEPTEFVAGHPANIDVTLEAAAPQGGTAVTLTSNDTGFAVPATVTVPAGATSVEVRVTPGSFSVRSQAIITAAANGTTVTKAFAILPNDISGLAHAATYIENGTSAPTTVTLEYPQPTDTTIQLSSNNPQVTVPQTVTIPAGQTSATFDVTVGTLSKLQAVQIKATINGAGPFTTYTVGPNGPRSLAFTPTRVHVGQAVSGVLQLWAPAPAGGAAVTLTSNDPQNVTIPQTVTIPEAATTITVPISTSGSLTSAVGVTVTATWNGQSRPGGFELSPAS